MISRAKLRSVFLILSAVVAFTLLAGPAEDKASSSGEAWLSLLDSGKYEESWKQSAAMFQSEVTQDAWLAALKQLREPMGELVSRSVDRVDFTKTLRGAPDGDYCIIHFKTNFKNKEGVTERVTLVKEKDEWKMAAYATH